MTLVLLLFLSCETVGAIYWYDAHNAVRLQMWERVIAMSCMSVMQLPAFLFGVNNHAITLRMAHPNKHVVSTVDCFTFKFAE